jgi:hypothetical protein
MVAAMIVAAPIIVGLPSIGAADKLQDALRAYHAGDYATALRLSRPLAEQGGAVAQCVLGVMYDNGQGVARNYAIAAKWYRKAAEQGDVLAQHNLGLMYFNGDGVAQDHVRAHMWLNIAGMNGDESGRRGKEVVARKMAVAQISEARKLALVWMAKLPRKTPSTNRHR